MGYLDVVKVPAYSDQGDILVGIHDLDPYAEIREKIHEHHASSRPLSPGYELVGLAGEWEFARITNLPMDLRTRPAGDGRVDFYAPVGEIDVKTYRKPFNLPREKGKKHAEILVLAKFYDSPRRAVLLGWEYDTVMVTCEVKTLPGQDIPNHCKPAEEIHPILSLWHMFKEASAVAP